MATATFTYTGIAKNSTGSARAIKLSSYSSATNFSGTITAINSITVSFSLGITNTTYNQYFVRAAFSPSNAPSRQSNSFYSLSIASSQTSLNYSNFTSNYAPTRFNNINIPCTGSTSVRTQYSSNTYITIANNINENNIENILNNGYLILYAANQNGGFTSSDLGDYKTSSNQQFSTNTANIVWGATGSYNVTITIDYTATSNITSTVVTVSSKSAINNNNGIAYSLNFTSANTIADDTSCQLTIWKYTAGADNGGWGTAIYTNSSLTWGGVKNGYTNIINSSAISNYDPTVSYGLYFRLSLSGLTQSADTSLDSTTTNNTSGTTSYVGNVTLINPYGVSFGQESTSTDTNPKFECAYPAYFPNGISLGGSALQTSWPSNNSNNNIKFQQGTLSGWPTTGDTYKTIDFSGVGFSSVPYVGLTIRYNGSNSTWDGHMRLSDVTTTGATVWSHLIQTTASNNVTYDVDWFAIGT